MRTIRSSRYNVRAAIEPDLIRYANTRTGAIIDVGSEIDQILANGTTQANEAALEPEIEDFLLGTGFLVDRDLDEIGAVFSDYEQTRSEHRLALTVAPTVACNLRCEYCYESLHPNRYIDERESEAIISFVAGRLQEGARSLDVTWFGGEPLLHFDGVMRMSRAFLNLATFNGVPYSATMVTNGTLLTPERAAQLRAMRVLVAQITLDGAQLTHDQLRIDGAGRGSYEKVIAGIAAAMPHLGVDLRVHADRRTARRIPRLLNDLAERGLTDIRVYFARIEPTALLEHGPPPDRSILTGPEFADLEVQWIEEAHELGFRATASATTSHGPTPCAAVSPHHFLFEPGRRVKRCWGDVANDAYQEGTIDLDGTVELTEADARWADYLPADLGCAECRFLPLCAGGCPKARLDGSMRGDLDDGARRAFKHDHVCNSRKFNMAKLLAKGLVE